MRHIVYVLLILPLFSVINTVHSTSQLVTDSAEALAPSNHPISEVRRERKERRLLRKKKQRMRELREEIRALTWSLHQANGGPVIGKTEMKHKQKGRHGRKGVKWRKNLLEKLKVIVRRLDRMERRIIGAKSILPPEFTINTTVSTEPLSPSTISTTTDASINLKIKRIQPAITRSRSGENGTVCVAHKDCRPGHCCHHVVTKESASSVCVMHGFPENAYCIDGCQCSTQLSCFLPEGNATEAFCKKASSVDVLQGSYLYRQDSTIVDM
ncbi:hypothetical protein Aduo_003902 [Ancylostoma duodenale]